MDNSVIFMLLAADVSEIWGWKLASILIQPLILLISVWLGLKLWHKQKQSEPVYQSREYLNRKKLDGLLAGWALLSYLTEVENARSLLVWTDNGKGQAKTFHLRPAQAREYIDQLNRWFYADGYGLLYSRRLKELLFECRSILYGFLLKENVLYQGDERIVVNNDKIINRLKELYQDINNELYEEMCKIYD